MLHDKSDVPTMVLPHSASRRSFAEAIGIASITRQLGSGIAPLALLAGNATLAIVVTAIVRLLIG